MEEDETWRHTDKSCKERCLQASRPARDQGTPTTTSKHQSTAGQREALRRGLSVAWGILTKKATKRAMHACANKAAASFSGKHPFSTILLNSSPPESLRERRGASQPDLCAVAKSLCDMCGCWTADLARPHSSMTMYVFSTVVTTSLSFTMWG